MHYCHCCEDSMSGCFVECFMLSSTDIHFTEMEATFQQFSSMLFKLRSHLLFYRFRSFYLLGCICFLLFNIKRRFPVTSVYYFSLWCQQTNQPKCLYCVGSGKKLDLYIPIQKACLHSYYQNHRYLVIVLFLILCGTS